MHTDGRGKDSWNIPAGGSLLPTSEETLKKGLQYFQMDGPAVFQTAIKVVPESIKKLLSKNKVSIDEVNYLIPHQPSVRILEEVANRISLPWEKVMTNMDRYANTSGGTIPMMLDETVKKNLLKEGDLVLFAAVGAGWTWGTALYKW